MPSNPHTLQQENIFSGFWERFNKQVASGQGITDFPSDNNLTPKHVTTVVRLPHTISQNIEAIGNKLLDKYPDHYPYPSTDLHFTFINLDAFFPTGLKKEHKIVFRTIEYTLNELPPLKMEVKGMVYSRLLSSSSNMTLVGGLSNIGRQLIMLCGKA